jgi:hypothetical protein
MLTWSEEENRKKSGLDSGTSRIKWEQCYYAEGIITSLGYTIEKTQVCLNLRLCILQACKEIESTAPHILQQVINQLHTPAVSPPLKQTPTLINLEIGWTAH